MVLIAPAATGLLTILVWRSWLGETFLAAAAALVLRSTSSAQEEGNSPLLIADRNVAFVIVYNHKMMYLDPKDTDNDTDYISDDRNDNDFDLDILYQEPQKFVAENQDEIYYEDGHYDYM